MTSQLTLRQITKKNVLKMQPMAIQAKFRKHQGLDLKARKAIQHQNFTKACIERRLVPQFLRSRLPPHLRHQSHLLQRGQRRTLIKVHEENNKRANDTAQQLKAFEDEQCATFLPFMRAVSEATNHKELKLMKSKQDRKLENLDRKPEPTNVNPPRPIFNLSSKTLTGIEEEALRYGMNMCWPQNVKDVDLKAETEMTFRRIRNAESLSGNDEEEVKSKLRTIARTLLKKKEKLPRKIIEMMKALRALSRDHSIYVSRLDKGNGVVIMDKADYNRKMEIILSDTSKFEEINTPKEKNIFIAKEDQVNRTLFQMKKKGHINEETYKQLRSTGCQPSRLYGLPKLHKSEVDPPLRPILSMMNSYCENIAKWLLSLLAPHLPSRFSLKDSFEASERILRTNVQHLNDVYITSFDAVQLFTSIPIQDTIEHILHIIPDNSLPISKETLKTLLQISCTKVPFRFNNKHYSQIDGLSMGSCLAPLMAEFTMHMIEHKITPPTLYMRYVDDSLAVFENEQQATEFLSRLNSQHPAVQFTIEKPTDGRINFLDMTVYCENKNLKTKWFLKPTNTLLYTHYKAFSPQTYKTNAINALYARSQKLTSDNINKNEAKEKVKGIFLCNGYPHKIIEKSFVTNSSNPRSTDEKRKIFWKLPYVKAAEKEIKKTTHSLNKIFKNVKIQIAFSTYKTQHMFPNKDKIQPNEYSSLVYKFTCEHCQACYIGETRRQLQRRIKEHLKGQPISEISIHEHPTSASNFEVITRTKLTRIAESILIKKHIKQGTEVLNNQRTSEFLLLF